MPKGVKESYHKVIKKASSLKGIKVKFDLDLRPHVIIVLVIELGLLV